MTERELLKISEYCEAVQTIRGTSKIKLAEYADKYLAAKAQRRIRHSQNKTQTIEQVIAQYLGINEEEYKRWRAIVNSGNKELIEAWEQNLLTTSEVYSKLLNQ